MTFAPPPRIFHAPSLSDALPSTDLLLHVTFNWDEPWRSFPPTPLIPSPEPLLTVATWAAAEVVLPSVEPLLVPPEREAPALGTPLADGAPIEPLSPNNAEPPVTHLPHPQAPFTPVLAIADQAFPLLESVRPILAMPDFPFMEFLATVPALPQVPRVNFVMLVPLPERPLMPADPAALLATLPAIPLAPAPALPSLPWPSLSWIGLHLPDVPIPPPLLADWML